MSQTTQIPDDENLLEQAQHDASSDALGILYDRYIPLVYGVCLHWLGNADDAEDAVMDIYFDLSQRIAEYRIRSFRPWLHTVARNHCLQILRRKRCEIPTDSSSRVMETAGIVHLFDEGHDEARFRALEQCMEGLPDKQRECIDKFFFGRKSYADIVAETRYPLRSVKSFLQNGKRNLKICMEHKSDETD